jgi:hypothetical protein
MIINDSHGFVFVHIPKCAGTSVRMHLSRFDTTDGTFTVSNGSHPEIGNLDMAHIPLLILKKYFPDTYKKIKTYEAFAIVRDPYQRFTSSLFQRLMMYGEGSARNLSVKALETATDEAIAFLELNADASMMPHDYIHFQPQHTYVQCDGQQIVQHIFEISDLAKFYTDAGARLGTTIEKTETLAAERIGAAKFYRSPTSRVAGQLLTPSIRRAIISVLPQRSVRAASKLLYEGKDTRFRKIADSPRIIKFIETFYAEDIALHQSISGARGSG